MRVRTGVLQKLYNLTLYVCVMLWMNIFFLSLSIVSMEKIGQN